MIEGGLSRAGFPPLRCLRATAVAACMLLGACAQSSGPSPLETLAGTQSKTETVGALPTDPGAELAKATEYWGKEYAKNPRDAKAALSYARNLKAMGEKRQALAVLQQASVFNATNRELNGEYGRLALEFDQVSVAQKLLENADDPANPDWRTISARGTVLAKQGRYAAAIPLYERALTLAPNQPSLLNNLALAHAMNGQPDRAEPLLKRAASAGGDPRVSQNLALVLSLQGKYDDAKIAAARHMSAEDASADVAYLRSMVKLDPLPPSPAGGQPARTAATQDPPRLKGTTTDAAPAGWSPLVATSPGQ